MDVGDGRLNRERNMDIGYINLSCVGSCCPGNMTMDDMPFVGNVITGKMQNRSKISNKLCLTVMGGTTQLYLIDYERCGILEHKIRTEGVRKHIDIQINDYVDVYSTAERYIKESGLDDTTIHINSYPIIPSYILNSMNTDSTKFISFMLGMTFMNYKLTYNINFFFLVYLIVGFVLYKLNKKWFKIFLYIILLEFAIYVIVNTR